MPYDKSVVVPLSADDTFALITQPDRLRRWHAVAARIDLRAGGDYRWTVVPGRYAAGTVTEVEPGRRLVLAWGWEGSTEVPPGASTVTITVEPTQDGTIVRLVHDGLSEEQEKGHTEGWNHYLDRLVVAGTDGDAGADPWHQREDLDEQTSAEATLAILQRVLRGIGPDDLGNSTPCTEFTVADLAKHLNGSVTEIGRMADAAYPEQWSGRLEDDLAILALPALEAWSKRGLGGKVIIGGMELPAGFALSILSIEFLVHAWDFATATGQELRVDDDLTTYVYGLATRLISPQIRAFAGFDDATEISPDADVLDRLIAFTGRPTG
jgi:uncharacterized protein (TIGR03086 family)